MVVVDAGQLFRESSEHFMCVAWQSMHLECELRHPGLNFEAFARPYLLLYHFFHSIPKGVFGHVFNNKLFSPTWGIMDGDVVPKHFKFPIPKPKPKPKLAPKWLPTLAPRGGTDRNSRRCIGQRRVSC